ncbi:MAG TPA: SCO family protein [Solirubrobacteraceae bacterium]|jgi:cytochrome oxidase Cu insertion factor (SCO1/SenC/PrrC family)|nr:SCO family protein [Solirubrobacteraceae bacterium]
MNATARATSRHALCALALLLAVAGCALRVAPARADGDPASDVLATQSFFAPVDTGFSTAQHARLVSIVDAAERSGLPVRVAIVPSAFDLGAVTEFWHEPQTYAHFLGIELSLVYHGPLLVAMPNGFGLYWSGHATAGAERALASIPIGRGGASLLNAIQRAIHALAASSGASLAAGSATAGSTGASDLLEVLVAVGTALALGLAAVFVAAQRRRRTGEERTPPSSRAWRGTLASALSWGLPVVVLAAAAGVIAHALRPGAPLRGTRTPQAVETTPYVFAPGQKRAPSFALSDQDGRPVSLSQYRGRSLLITFVDPRSGEGTPPSVAALGRAERELPAARRPAILAVSVDVYADAPATLLRDMAAWHTPPQWRWVVGPPARLRALWNRFYVVVDVKRERAGAATVHRVVHSKMAYLIDPSGFERALLAWPFGAKEIVGAVHAMERV